MSEIKSAPALLSIFIIIIIIIIYYFNPHPRMYLLILDREERRETDRESK